MADSIEVARYKLSTPAGSNDVLACVTEKDKLFFVLELAIEGDRTKAGVTPRKVSITVDEARLLIEMTKPGGSK